MFTNKTNIAKSGYYLFILIMMISCIVACKSKNKNEEKTVEEKIRIYGDTIILNKEQIKNAGVKISSQGIEDIHQTVTATGIVEVPPQSLVSVSATMGGYLRHTNLLTGSHVSKGQRIATLEDPVYVQLQEDYLSAKAKLQYAKSDLDRQKDLQENNATSTKNYQLALRDYNSLLVEIKSLEQKLRIININPANVSLNNITRSVSLYSPINGFVSKVNVNIGKYVSPSEVLFELVNPSDIHAAINIFENDIMNFRPGMKGTVYLSPQPDKRYDVEVVLVSKDLTENRSAVLYCNFLNAGHNLLPGMFLNAEFSVKNFQSKAVSEMAVVHFEGSDYVFVAKNDSTFVMTPVTAIASPDGMVTLQPESVQSENIVTNGAFNLLGAMKGGGEE